MCLFFVVLAWTLLSKSVVMNVIMCLHYGCDVSKLFPTDQKSLSYSQIYKTAERGINH